MPERLLGPSDSSPRTLEDGARGASPFSLSLVRCKLSARVGALWILAI